MGFINTESIQEDDDFILSFSDTSDEEQEPTISDEEFIDDDSIEKDGEGAGFYRGVDNRENYFYFSNQTKNPIQLINREHSDNFGDDNQPEPFDPQNREQVEFDEFDQDKIKSRIFKESLLNFLDVENNFFYAVIYGLSHIKLHGIDVKLENSKETLGESLFFSLKKIETLTKLDRSHFAFFERCQKINKVLAEHGYFLRFYERQNKFRYQIKKKLKDK